MARLIAAVAACLLAFAASADAECDELGHNPVDLAEYYADTIGRTGEDLKSALNEAIKSYRRCAYAPFVWAMAQCYYEYARLILTSENLQIERPIDVAA